MNIDRQVGIASRLLVAFAHQLGYSKHGKFLKPWKNTNQIKKGE
jgi:hypothetical protein